MQPFQNSYFASPPHNTSRPPGPWKPMLMPSDLRSTQPILSSIRPSRPSPAPPRLKYVPPAKRPGGIKRKRQDASPPFPLRHIPNSSMTTSDNHSSVLALLNLPTLGPFPNRDFSPKLPWVCWNCLGRQPFRQIAGKVCYFCDQRGRLSRLQVLCSRSLDELPAETIHHICERLNQRDLGSFRCTSELSIYVKFVQLLP